MLSIEDLRSTTDEALIDVKDILNISPTRYYHGRAVYPLSPHAWVWRGIRGNVYILDEHFAHEMCIMRPSGCTCLLDMLFIHGWNRESPGF